MNVIHLHGALGARFEPRVALEIASAAEAVRALSYQFPGFYDEIRGGAYRLVRGGLQDGVALGENELRFGLGGRDLHIIPAPEGAKQGSTGKIILGVIIAAMAIYSGQAQLLAADLETGGFIVAESAMEAQAFAGISYGNIASFGVNMAINGIGQLLTPAPRIGNFGQFDRPDQRPSFLFTGPVNVSHQGAAVPVVYGQSRVGTVVVSSGLQPEE